MKKFFTKFQRPSNPSIKFDPEKSKTLGSEKDACDINKILDTYKRTGQLPSMTAGGSFVARNPQFGDFSNATDFTTVRYMLDEAERQFMSLPAHIRKRFDNNPQLLIEFLSNEENRSEAEKLGLIEKVKQVIEPLENASPVKDAAVSSGTAESGTVGTI